MDYILEDHSEMVRLRIRSRPQEQQRRVIRAPVPWHDAWQEVQEAQSQQLFTTSSVMRSLQELWNTK